MAFVDYYKILGVDKNIPQKDVQAAYRKQFHQDLHPDDPKAKAKFQALNEAYQVINDPEKRKKYDQYGEHWREAGNFGGQQEAGGWSSGSPFEGFDFSSMGGGSGNGFSSFFENLFGGGGFHSRHQSSMQGGMQQDMEASVSIDLYTALLGGEVMVQLGDGSRIKLRVKPETQNGTKVRLRAKGYDLGNGQRSDLIITYNVTLPTGLNARQKELLRQMQQLS